ncbi:hypothetical protein G6F68_014464 [Rhizopus microsporus]|nr:hypothetical protein G6F68_014464 [Rhizopus microsporus]
MHVAVHDDALAALLHHGGLRDAHRDRVGFALAHRAGRGDVVRRKGVGVFKRVIGWRPGPAGPAPPGTRPGVPAKPAAGRSIRAPRRCRRIASRPNAPPG